MDKYLISKILGDGTYGTVYYGIVKSTQEKVAIKKMKKNYYSWDECLELKEVKALRKLHHCNIVKLKELVRENDVLYFIFEHMNGNLYELMKKRSKGFSEDNIRTISYQILNAVAYLHRQGFFHRDIKPENFLYNNIDSIKLADFGLAREIRSRPPFSDYVSTRWYRAPELLLRSTNYSPSVDIWAVACIIIELHNLRPVFPGTSEIDQLFKICTILGTPSRSEWAEGYRLSTKMNFKWPNCAKLSLLGVVRKASNSVIELLDLMLSFNPESRPSAATSLKCEYFLKTGVDIKKSSTDGQLHVAQKKHQSLQNDLIYPSLRNQNTQKYSFDEEISQEKPAQIKKMSSPINLSNLFKKQLSIPSRKAENPILNKRSFVKPERRFSKLDDQNTCPILSIFSGSSNKKSSGYAENKKLYFNDNHKPRVQMDNLLHSDFEDHVSPFTKRLFHEAKGNDHPTRTFSITGVKNTPYVHSLFDHVTIRSLYPDKPNISVKRTSRRLNPLENIFDK